MSEFAKVLALAVCGILGYLYAVSKIKDDAQESVRRLEEKEDDDYREIQKSISDSSLSELIRKSNDRLRKRRSPPDNL